LTVAMLCLWWTSSGWSRIVPRSRSRVVVGVAIYVHPGVSMTAATRSSWKREGLPCQWSWCQGRGGLHKWLSDRWCGFWSLRQAGA
jgi:hypothetical protein